MNCSDFNCVFMRSNGSCSQSACRKLHYSIKENMIVEHADNCIIFPQTIGDITFYTKQELIDWVLKHQLPSVDFIREFNANKVSEEFLDSCRKAGELFSKNKEQALDK